MVYVLPQCHQVPKGVNWVENETRGMIGVIEWMLEAWISVRHVFRFPHEKIREVANSLENYPGPNIATLRSGRG